MNPLALFTLDQLKAWAKVPTDVDAQDGIFEMLGQAASDYCERRIGEQFASRVYTITRDGDSRRLLLRLPRPITAVSALTIDGIAVDPSEYSVNAASGKIALKCRVFTCGVGNIVVTLTAGYAPDALPGDVVAAALDLAKSHYEEWTNGAISLSSVSIGPASMVIKPGLNPRIEKFLDGRRDTRA